MLIGSHTIIQSKDADADKAFLRDVLGLPHVDSGGGWLIFGLPPSEVAIHPSSKNDEHNFYLICSDIEAFVAEMKRRRVACSPIQVLRWGKLIELKLPGGGKLGVYEALHARPATKAAKPKAAKPKAAKPKAAKPKAKRATKTRRRA
jgi:hypothetical protein